MNKKLQVFVSSTYTDLKEERQAAVEAILDAGHIPAGMELFKAGNESQLKTIYKWIDESDVYMLILGGRYGSIEPNSGKSYTELEYRYALDKNIPVFAVVISETFLTQKINSLGLSNVTETTAPDKYKEFKLFVMSKIVRNVDDYKDIKIAIHTTLNDFIHEYNLTGWVRNTNEEDIIKLLKENNSLNKKIENLQNQLSQKTQQHFGAYSFEELVSILKNKIVTFKDGSSTNILDFFISHYHLFASTHYNENWYASTSDYRIIRFLEAYNLIYEIDKRKSDIATFAITKEGNIFYVMLESNNLTQLNANL